MPLSERALPILPATNVGLPTVVASLTVASLPVSWAIVPLVSSIVQWPTRLLSPPAAFTVIVTSSVALSRPSSAVRRSTYVPATENVAVVART